MVEAIRSNIQLDREFALNQVGCKHSWKSTQAFGRYRGNTFTLIQTIFFLSLSKIISLVRPIKAYQYAVLITTII